MDNHVFEILLLMAYSGQLVSSMDMSLYHPPHQILKMVNGTLVLQQSSCIAPDAMLSCEKSCTPQGHVYPTCHCDKFCELFQDCCPGYHRCGKEVDNNQEFHDVYDRIVPYMQYLKCADSIHEHVKDRLFFGEYMVRTCDVSYRNPLIRGKCENLVEEITHQQPVTDRKSGVTFRNVYCAQCHYRGLDDTTPWGHGSICSTVTPERLIWAYFDLRELALRFCAPKILDGVTSRSCKAEVPFYSQMQNTETLISSCPRHFTKIEIERQCAYHLDPILGKVDEKPQAFRNVYCAECHGLKISQLFCAAFEQIWPDDGPPQPSIVGPENNVQIPSLMSLITIPPVQCPKGEILDPFTKGCRARKRCGFGYTEFRHSCVLNLMDKYAYENPVTNNGNEVSLKLELQFAKPLTLLLHRDFTLEEKFRLSFESWRTAMLKTGKDGINSLSLNGRIETIPIRDGHIYNISGPLTLTFKVKVRKSRAAIVEHLLEVLQIYNSENYDRFRARFQIFSKSVTQPLKCNDGQLISIQLNETYTDLLGSLRKYNLSESHLLEYDQNVNEKHPYPKVHLCQLAAAKFQNCTLLNYSASDFVKSLSGVVSDYGAIDSGDYFISKGLIFTCLEMITSKQDLLHAKVLGYITIAGFLVSILFLFYTLLTYCLFASLRTTPGKMIMNLSGILFLAKISLLISTHGVNNRIICTMIGLIQHYLWLTMFFCMNAIAIFTVRTFTTKALRSPVDSKRSYRIAIAYTYSLPIVVIAVCLGLHFSREHGIYGALNNASACWIKSRSIFLYAFVAPICIILAVNLVFFLATTRAIHATRAAATSADSETTEQDNVNWEVSLYIRLSFLMGFTWIFGVLGVFYQSLALNYLFVMANSLTGVYLAVGFMCTGRVFNLYKNRNQKPKPGTMKSPVYSVREHLNQSSSGLQQSSSALMTTSRSSLKT